ncbi:MAG: hypothetical protein F4Y03_10265 [Alphaproteobacteria bacterium]|nr:hypothetical protein [Alphaproteobacteria bacterium]
MNAMTEARRNLLLAALRADRCHNGPDAIASTAAVARGSGIDRRRVAELLAGMEAEGLVRLTCGHAGGRTVRFWSIEPEAMQ